ncbi:unnamed protein product [Symbiodinium pilosum]|uniref:Uncharacterized protein n=1 Tax=Symbiodinium pilosum TaxID=2952 RepID=A0A812TSJ3_SYMPI|nr:unnamed protein product [Symbiodinium pilosum]
MVRPAALAGFWCLLTSFSSCVLTRDGFPYPYNGAISGLFSGAVLSIVNRWDKDSTLWTMAGSSVLSILSHYATEGQSMNVKARNSTSSALLTLSVFSPAAAHLFDVHQFALQAALFCRQCSSVPALC